jgi:hypothetical protein
MVRQFTQTQDAYSYYERLNDFSSSDNVFSQIQPGFLEGNLKSILGDEEKVLGYFEVAAVNQERVYFNYADLFPGEPLPPFVVNCEPVGKPALYPRGFHCIGDVCDGACESPLIQGIQSGLITFFAENDNFEEELGAAGRLGGLAPYLTKVSACGDCTQLGSNIVPDFWIEE